MWQPSNDGLGYWFVIEWLILSGINIKYYKDADYVERFGNERTKEILRNGRIKKILRGRG